MLVLVANDEYLDTDDLEQEDYCEWCRIREEEDREAMIKNRAPNHIKSIRFLREHRRIYYVG